MYIELRLSDLRDIKDILKEIEYDLSIAINKTHQYIDNGDYLGGSYSVEVSKGMEERNSELKEAMNFIHEFDDKVSEIIELIKSKAKITNEDVTFVYDAKKLGNNLSKIKKLLDFRGEEYKKVLNLNSTYLEWEKEVSNRLDDTLWEAIKDPIEEMKQRDDEKVFRHNKRIMQGLEEKIRDITFVDCIEDIESIKKSLDGLEELDDIKDLTDILINNIRFGTPPKVNVNIIMNNKVDGLLLEKILKDYKDSLPDELLDIINKFNSGGTLVVSGSLISDDVLQNLRNSGFFIIENTNGKYRFSLKYDDITKWARDNTDTLDNIVEKAMKNGMSGIYKLDPKTGKWYTYDKAGNIEKLTELPKGVSKGVGVVGEILGPLGIAIDVNTIYEGWKSGDSSEFGGAVGGVAGGWAGATVGTFIVSAVATEGASIGAYLIVGILGGVFGTSVGHNAGEKIGELFEEEQMYWEG